MRRSRIPTPAVLAVAEAFWPKGLQEELGDPVVLELDPNEADLPRLEELKVRVFTSVDALLRFVEHEQVIAAGQPDETAAKVTSDSQISDVEADFSQRMNAVYDRGRSEAGYDASYFLSMLSQYGPQETAHKLLTSPAISDGFAELWERGRLHLTVEALAVEPKFSELFSESEIAVARKRLEQFGYSPSVSGQA